MQEELDVVVMGLDADPRQAQAALIRVFGIDPDTAERFISGLPGTATRHAPRSLAERYAEALRSIGARVELWPTGSSLPAGVVRMLPSLPAPLWSAAARSQSLAKPEPAEHGAPGALEVNSLRFAGGIDLVNPDIPRAPALPHDLSRMPNAAAPRFSDRPSQAPNASTAAPAPPPHADAQLPPAVSGAFLGNADCGTGHDARDGQSVRPHAIGLRGGQVGSVRPGLGPISAWPKAQAPRKRWRGAWLLALLVLALAIGLGLRLGWLRSADQRRADDWQRQGIDPGRHERADSWLAVPGHEIEGAQTADVRLLLERLHRAGVDSVHAIRIEAHGPAERARALLIELPTDPTARRTALFFVARSRGLDHALADDRGVPYYVLSFPNPGAARPDQDPAR